MEEKEVKEEDKAEGKVEPVVKEKVEPSKKDVDWDDVKKWIAEESSLEQLNSLGVRISARMEDFRRKETGGSGLTTRSNR